MACILKSRSACTVYSVKHHKTNHRNFWTPIERHNIIFFYFMQSMLMVGLKPVLVVHIVLKERNVKEIVMPLFLEKYIKDMKRIK